MAGNKLTIKLTDDQQKQIKNATGSSITELKIDLGESGGLSEEDSTRCPGVPTTNTKVRLSNI